jgi:protein-L-isoaspartate(D-aspartate) O-methyltransferase
MDLNVRRQFYAEEIQATANLRNAAVVEALARVPRERFLPPGPWTIHGEAGFQQPPRQTADADPRHVYHNLSIAIDPARQLFNGAPGLLAMVIDTLMLKPGDRVLHVGCGTGYYTALMASCVGPTGRIIAIEIDEDLARRARTNLASSPWVEVCTADGHGPFSTHFDAVLINAGITHPLSVWTDALAVGGRMIAPVTCAVTPTIGKGPMVQLLRRPETGDLEARIVGFVAIYSAIGLRDTAVNDQIGHALRMNPAPPLKRWRVEPHAPSASCWLHTVHGCLSLT